MTVKHLSTQALRPPLSARKLLLLPLRDAVFQRPRRLPSRAFHASKIAHPVLPLLLATIATRDFTSRAHRSAARAHLTATIAQRQAGAPSAIMDSTLTIRTNVQSVRSMAA